MHPCESHLLMKDRAFNIAEYADGKPQQPLPKALGPHVKDLGQFADLCHDLCNKLLGLFALGLKMCSFIASIACEADLQLRSIPTMAAKIGSPLGTTHPRALQAVPFACSMYGCPNFPLAVPSTEHISIPIFVPSRLPTMNPPTSAQELTAITAL